MLFIYLWVLIVRLTLRSFYFSVNIKEWNRKLNELQNKPSYTFITILTANICLLLLINIMYCLYSGSFNVLILYSNWQINGVKVHEYYCVNKHITPLLMKYLIIICFLCFRAGGMAKRIADKELTDRNWDQEEEGEEVTIKLA